jgi:hypothetical protein
MEVFMSDPTIGERIAHALAERRPQPSSDFEAHLERAIEPPRYSPMTAVLAVAAMACAIVVVVVTRPGSESRTAPTERPEHTYGQPPPRPTLAPTLPHDGKFSANQCNTCHQPAPRPPTPHEPNGRFPLVGGHRTVSCATCHVPNQPPQRAPSTK